MTWNPGILLPLLLSALGYVAGTARLWRRAGPGHGVSVAAAASFAAAWTTLAIALVSPLHELGESLFSLHMVQHELLMVVAAPLFVISRPVVPWLWAMPMAWRRALGALSATTIVHRSWIVLRHPVVNFTLHAVAIWAWHIPRWYDAAVTNETLHALQHISFLATALLFWWAIIERGARHHRIGGALASVAATAAHTGVLGALLTFARHPVYTVYHGATAWNLTPLQDQQLAGLIMWIPAGMVYVGAALWLLSRWLDDQSTSEP